MRDEEMRRLERSAAAGDPTAAQQLVIARARTFGVPVVLNLEYLLGASRIAMARQHVSAKKGG